MSSHRDERAVLAAILLLAGTLRLVACVVWSHDLSRDPDAYHGLAERLAAGHGFVAPDGRPTAYRPPLYPLLLAAVIPAGKAGVAVLQIVLGIATVALTATTARRLGLGRWSLLAAVLVAVDPLLLRYTPHVMTEVTCAFLSALVLWFAAHPTRIPPSRIDAHSPPSPSGEWLGVRGQSDSRSSLAPAPTPALNPQPSTLNFLLLGLAFGLAALSRPTFLGFGVLAALAWLLNSVRGGRETSAVWVRFKYATVVLLGASLMLAPWALRNALVLGSPILTTTHGGYTLLLANNPVFWREVVLAPSGAVWAGDSLDAWQRSLEAAMASDGVPHDEIARDRWHRERAIRQIRAEPVTLLRATAYRLGRLWSPTPSVESLPPPVGWAVTAFSLTTFALALAGLASVTMTVCRATGAGVRAAPLSVGPWCPALLLIASFTAVHAVYWTDARMRAPLVPAVALFAALGAASVVQASYTQAGRGLAPALRQFPPET